MPGVAPLARSWTEVEKPVGIAEVETPVNCSDRSKVIRGPSTLIPDAAGANDEAAFPTPAGTTYARSVALKTNSGAGIAAVPVLA